MLLELVVLIELVLIISVIFIERKQPSEAFSWVLIILFLPGLGYILYLIFGETWSKKRAKRLKESVVRDNYKNELSRYYQYLAQHNYTKNDYFNPYVKDLIDFHRNYSYSLYTSDNDIEVFTWGEDKFSRLFQDIDQAQDSIHVMYFKIYRDSTGKQLVDHLTQKAKEGIKVRVIYDAIGSMTPKSFFHPLIEAGGQVQCYEESIFKNLLRLNFRNHRKMAIIDGKIGYMGGMNVGDTYLSQHKIKTPWRDTHMRITGSSVLVLQFYFFQDWARLSSDITKDLPREKIARYFPSNSSSTSTTNTNGSGMQLVINSADTDSERIKMGIIKMINSATENIQIQSPYFVPDRSMIQALKIAIYSGVKVQIMIPEIPSSFFLKPVSLSFAGELLEAGAEVYLYQGYIHAKTVQIDGEVCTIGSTNIDIRSFRLSDEINAFIYDKDFSEKHRQIFLQDIYNSSPLYWEEFKNRGAIRKIIEDILRLFSPLM
ncbi:cardiolipin synthase [Natranaerobius thermophilus]|uniref:Cardiolipin synthase n=1 Tax=Natranaerobius thermophilus (strain ATCC BAA-1301 / DSM 18059 / JW/NM-WN-LF) TaxID=457570 RepID=B2A8D0_NATTJ|nr:cardiolipin synthase [Natranaerobius thermophilus]ACB84496.1 phospholipase D/Transphosphatidylase [Natranaerobius thermophilus JW/NM-WN-LF]